MHLFLRLTGFFSFTLNSVSSDKMQEGDSSLAITVAIPRCQAAASSSQYRNNPPQPSHEHGQTPRHASQTSSKSQMHLPVLATECWVPATYPCGWQIRLPAARLLTRQPDVGSGAAAAVGSRHLQPLAAGLAGHDG